MNILCLEQFAGLGGGQLSLLSLLPGFASRGWRSVVVVPQQGPLAERARTSGFEVTTLHCTPFANGRKSLADMARFTLESPRLISVIARMIRSYGIDVVYVNAPRLLPAAALAARIRSTPLVFHCHNRLVQRSGIIAAGTALRISRAHAIACCRYAASPIREYLAPQHLSVLYNGVERLASNTCPARQSMRRIGVIGRIEPEKGQLEFVRAARAVATRFPECRFIIVGTPLFSNSHYFDEVAKLSRDLPVDFLGWRDDVPAILSSLDLLVVPSSALDAAPRVIFEAFSARVPVLAFPSGGIPEIVTDEKTGFLTSVTTAHALEERICSVIEMAPARVETVVKRAWMQWRQDYTVERYQEDVGNVLLDVVATHRQKHRVLTSSLQRDDI